MCMCLSVCLGGQIDETFLGKNVSTYLNLEHKAVGSVIVCVLMSRQLRESVLDVFICPYFIKRSYFSVWV